MRTQVEETIEAIRPALQADGGDIVLRDVDEDTGVVTVTLVGACGTCPAHRHAEGRHRADHARPRRRRHRSGGGLDSPRIGVTSPPSKISDDLPPSTRALFDAARAGDRAALARPCR